MNPIHTGQGSTSSQVGSSGSAWESKRSIMPQIAIPSIAGVGRRTPVGGPPLSLADLGNLRNASISLEKLLFIILIIIFNMAL